MAKKFEIRWTEQRYLATVLTADSPREARQMWKEQEDEFWENIDESDWFTVKGTVVLQQLEEEEVES